MPIYDYIIIGAGASGLLLADALGRDSFFADKSILLIEKDSKTKNDRTWCFWEGENGRFNDIVHKSWRTIRFAGQEIDEELKIRPYNYKMLRGIDFYQAYLERIERYPKVKLIKEEVSEILDKGDKSEVKCRGQSFFGKQTFDSRFDYSKLKQQSKYPVLQQHFLGWFVKTKQQVFKDDTATFMDFSIPQKGNTRFMYVLPFSTTFALVEYTLFSAEILEESEYESAIREYLENLGATDYEIIEKERGNIPMTCFDFTKDNTANYLKIGIAGGWAKASTGFTFYNSIKKVNTLVQFLKTGKPLSKFQKKNRYWFYDLLFLDVLYKNNHLGSHVFESLFKKRTPQLVLKFLDEDTTIWEELKVMWACPKAPFINALFKRIF